MLTYLNDNTILVTDNDYIGKIINETKDFYQIDLLKSLTPYLKGTVIDIRSNIGNHTIYFAKNNNVKKVISIESNPDNIIFIKTNIQLNKLWNKIEVYQLVKSIDFEKLNNLSLIRVNDYRLEVFEYLKELINKHKPILCVSFNNKIKQYIINNLNYKIYSIFNEKIGIFTYDTTRDIK